MDRFEVNELPNASGDFDSDFKNKVYCNNCDLILPMIPSCSIDMILTDPPYKDYQSNRPIVHEKVKKIHEGTFSLDLFVYESARVLKPGSHFYCWCDHLTFPGILASIENYNKQCSTKEDMLKYKNCLVWIKNNHGSGDLRGNYAPQHEFVIFAAKGRGRPFNGKRPSNTLFYKDNTGHIQSYKKVSNNKFNHGTIKPTSILRNFILSSTNPRELVLDPYAGSLSTAVACIETGRKYLMIEIDGEHISGNLDRLSITESDLFMRA